MNILQRVWVSSLGRKYIMALTGGALLLFVLGHMAGNLQVFLGPGPINAYGHFLKSTPELLWPARLGLLVCLALHVASAVSLSISNRAARPEAYVGNSAYAAGTASKTMLVSGLIIASFVVYHLLHYTLTLPGVNGYGLDFSTLRDPATGHQDIFAMVVMGFRKWPVSLFYLISVGLLSMHLGHGVAAMFQSLGLRNHVWAPRIAVLSRVLPVALFAGYAVIPVAVMLGYGSDHLEALKGAKGVPGGAAVEHRESK